MVPEPKRLWCSSATGHLGKVLTSAGLIACAGKRVLVGSVVMALLGYQPKRAGKDIPGIAAPAWLMFSCMLLVDFAGGQQGTMEQYNFSLSVRENVPNGTLVGDVRDAKFNPPYAKWMPQATDNRTINSFIVDIESGQIITKGELDREEQEHHTIIISTSFVSPKLVIVDIRVLDVNDITPAFLNPVLNVSIPETAQKDHKIPLGSVRDEDLGENSTQKVEIVSGNEENDFILQIKNSSNVDKILDLVVNTYHLDYERTHFYSFVIRATDGGGRYSDMRVNINILDHNDNEPIFNISKYSVKVMENVTVGTPIIQVHATDIDTGENSRITYGIDHISDPEEYFTINATTGWVMVNKPLDYETRYRFSLQLEARDNGSTPQTGKAALDIIVENINEQPANISLQFQPLFNSGHVREDTSVGTLVAVSTIEDVEVKVNSDMEVVLYNSDGYFTLNKTTTGHGLYINSPLDRETKSSFEMSIQITDSGNPPLRASKIFKVIIDDVNDNPPVFEKSEYTADVEETAEVGKEVIKVSATDRDVGANARITYHIQDSSQHLGWFSVDSSTGIITTKATMDCELSPQPVLVIVATDGGDPPLVGSAQVMISVRDVNDKEPEFETSFYSIKIAENRRVGDCVLTVSTCSALPAYLYNFS